MPPPGTAKGIIFFSSLIAPVLFSSVHPTLSRVVSTTGKVTGKWWDEVRVGPWFNGWRMKEGAAKELGSMSYSYGYVARVKGSENAQSETRQVDRVVTDNQDLLDGELTLIETKLNPQGARDRSKLVGKDGVVGVIGGYTKKKFILIGAGDNQQVEFQGLVSIVKGHNYGDKGCLGEVPEGNIENGKDGVVKELRDKFGKLGLFVNGQKDSSLRLGGRLVLGNCRNTFYRRDGQMLVVEQLKKAEGSERMGIQELKVEGGLSIAVAKGVKFKDKGEEIIAPSVLVRNNEVSSYYESLWAGLQDGDKVYDGKEIKKREKDGRQGNVVIHDWFFTNSKDNLQNLKEGGKHAKKISLNSSWKYYLWDPSYTEIKNGKLQTKDGKELPFKLEIGKFVTTELIK